MTYFGGWLIITISYFVTLYLSFIIGANIFPIQEQIAEYTYRVIEENITYLEIFVTIMMIIVPYVIAGIYSRIQIYHKPVKTALWISVVPVVSERLLIFVLGLYYAPKFLSEWDITSIVPFVQVKTPAIYFSYPYIISGMISILITVTISKTNRKD